MAVRLSISFAFTFKILVSFYFKFNIVLILCIYHIEMQTNKLASTLFILEHVFVFEELFTYMSTEVLILIITNAN